MAVDARIADKDGQVAEVHTRDEVPGLTVYTLPRETPDVLFLPFLNDTFGNQMAQTVTFTGTPELIHDGGDAVGWTGSIIAGTWDFADTLTPKNGTKCVSLTSGDNNDSAIFADATETDFNAFTAITGSVRLDVFTSTQHTITLAFFNDGSIVGNTVNLNDFINTGITGAYQGFAVSKTLFGIATETVDEFRVILTRMGGAKPTFRFDDLQIEESGSPIVFSLQPPTGIIYNVNEVLLAYVDNVSSTLADASMPNIAFDAILGVSQLPIGTVFTRIKNEETLFSATIRTIGDSIKGGASLESVISDGTNTCVTLRTTFPTPVRLDGDFADRLDVIINDDLSGLLSFTGLNIGSIVTKGN